DLAPDRVGARGKRRTRRGAVRGRRAGRAGTRETGAERIHRTQVDRAQVGILLVLLLVLVLFFLERSLGRDRQLHAAGAGADARAVELVRQWRLGLRRLVNALCDSAVWEALGTRASVLVTEAGALEDAHSIVAHELDEIDLAC